MVEMIERSNQMVSVLLGEELPPSYTRSIVSLIDRDEEGWTHFAKPADEAVCWPNMPECSA